MRHHQRGNAEPLLQLAHLDLHVLAQLLVERAKRFVEQQHGRLDHQRAGERNTLLLPAGQLMRIARAERLQPHHCEGGFGLLQRLGLRNFPHLQSERDVVRDVEMRKQRIILEQHPDIALVHRDWLTGLPLMAIAPADGRISPAIIRIMVVLPQPLGPSRESTCPCSTPNETSLTASDAP